MDDIDKFNVKLIKENLVNTLESGSITDPQVQYKIIEDSIRSLCLIKDKKLFEVISKYFEDQAKLKKQIEGKQKELQKIIDEYGDNVKEIYEMVKGL